MLNIVDGTLLTRVTVHKRTEYSWYKHVVYPEGVTWGKHVLEPGYYRLDTMGWLFGLIKEKYYNGETIKQLLAQDKIVEDGKVYHQARVVYTLKDSTNCIVEYFNSDAEAIIRAYEVADRFIKSQLIING